MVGARRKLVSVTLSSISLLVGFSVATVIHSVLWDDVAHATGSDLAESVTSYRVYMLVAAGVTAPALGFLIYVFLRAETHNQAREQWLDRILPLLIVGFTVFIMTLLVAVALSFQ